MKIKAIDCKEPKFYYVYNCYKSNGYCHPTIIVRSHHKYEENGKRFLPSYSDNDILSLEWQGDSNHNFFKIYGLQCSFSTMHYPEYSVNVIKKLNLETRETDIKKIVRKLNKVGIKRFVSVGKNCDCIPRKYKNEYEKYKMVYESIKV